MNLILIRDQNNYIATSFNKIPWKIERDFEIFRILTKNDTLLMGRKTWETIPSKPLINRTNVILSNSLIREKLPKEVQLYRSYSSFKKAFNINVLGLDFVWCIGGVNLYKQCVKDCGFAIITTVKNSHTIENGIQLSNKILDNFVKLFTAEETDEYSVDFYLNKSQPNIKAAFWYFCKLYNNSTENPENSSIVDWLIEHPYKIEYSYGEFLSNQKGWVSLFPFRDGWKFDIYVRPEYRHQGIATNFLNTLKLKNVFHLQFLKILRDGEKIYVSTGTEKRKIFYEKIFNKKDYIFTPVKNTELSQISYKNKH